MCHKINPKINNNKVNHKFFQLDKQIHFLINRIIKNHKQECFKHINHLIHFSRKHRIQPQKILSFEYLHTK